uniref:DUF6057 family protein n=1 Tax=uncultured Draconibacterium sp. TaxID=1573823 RepID=UPI00321692FE
MNSIAKNNIRLPLVISYILFLTLGTFYYYWFTEYLFFYQEKSTVFFVGFSYLKDHLTQPGGLLTYLSKFQAGLYYFPLAGALILNLEICGIILLLQKIGRRLNNKMPVVLPFLIGAVLFVLQINYLYAAVNNLAILIVLAFVYFSVTFLKEKSAWFLVLCLPFLYYLLGSFSFLFGLLYTPILAAKNQWTKIGLMWLTAAIFFFIGEKFLFYQTIETLLVYPFSLDQIGMQVFGFSFVILLIVAFPLFTKIKVEYKIETIRIKNISLLHVIPFLLILILVFPCNLKINRKYIHYFHTEKLFYEHKYEDLIRFNVQFPSNNMLTVFTNNIALAEIGRLSDMLFRFNQSLDGKTLFLEWQKVTEVLKRGAFYYYAIGMINEAQRWAYEYMVMKGNTPELLELMIKTDIIKGNYNIAGKYVSMLEKTLFYKKEAKRYRNMLHNDEAVIADSELGKKRKQDIKSDFFVIADNPPVNINKIIKADSLNKQALEYKLSWLMLNKDMKGIVAMLPLLEEAGYTRIPANVEEVVVTYKLLKIGELPKLLKLKVNPGTEQRFKRFYQIYQQNKGNTQQAKRSLSGEFKNTYWYYVFFG